MRPRWPSPSAARYGSEQPTRPARPLAVLALTPTLLTTLLASFYPSVFSTLRRDPWALLHGELWRLVSPVLVQADFLQSEGRWRAIAVWGLVATILVIAERALGTRRSLLLYGVGALVGHGVGELWQPYGAGCSVAGCGVLGGIVGWLWRAKPLPLKIGATAWLTAAAVLTVLQDIHGPPLLAGACIGLRLSRAVPLPERWARHE